MFWLGLSMGIVIGYYIGFWVTDRHWRNGDGI